MRSLLGKASLGNAAWTLTKIYYTNKRASISAGPLGVDFKTDGTKAFVLLGTSVLQYSLSTAWDISTSSYDSVSVSIGGSRVDIAFKSDGVKMYVLGASGLGGLAVSQYSLTAWDLSTAADDLVSLDVSGQITNPRGLAFKTDGTRAYIGGFTPAKIFQYSLSSAWDLSTAAYDSVSSPVLQGGGTGGLAFKTDGTKVFHFGSETGFVYQYTLSTAWDLSTASYDNVSFYVGTQSLGVAGLKIKSDGASLYIASAQNPPLAFVSQYSL